MSKVLTENHGSSCLCYRIPSGSSQKPPKREKSSHLSGSDHLTYNREHSPISFFFFLSFSFFLNSSKLGSGLDSPRYLGQQYLPRLPMTVLGTLPESGYTHFLFSFFLLRSSERTYFMFSLWWKKSPGSFFKRTLEFCFLALKKRNLSSWRLSQGSSESGSEGFCSPLRTEASRPQLPRQTAPAAKNTRELSSSGPGGPKLCFGGAFKTLCVQATPQGN